MVRALESFVGASAALVLAGTAAAADVALVVEGAVCGWLVAGG